MNILAAINKKNARSNALHNAGLSDQDYRQEVKLPLINGGNFGHETNNYVDDLKSGQNNILVAVRARPLNSREVNISNFETIRVLDGKVVVLLDPQNQFDPNDVFRNNRNKEKQYAFDFAFDNMTDTETVFENTTKFLIPGVLNGFNATVFAYGPTGTGKTHTMLGGSNKPGIMFLTMNELFKHIHLESENKQFTIRMSYLEVYNETLRDLMSLENNTLDIREDAKGITIVGITEITANNAGDVMMMLQIGSKNRTMEPTAANTVSSRSHAVLQITVEHKDKNQGISEEVTVSKLSLIDLAGSERASNTNNSGQRMIEGANINKSLLALGNCITLLSEKNEKGLKNIHIPYRDSKLTRLLKDSLGGNCRTVMIANISPSVIGFDDTYNTLKYANRAKNIKTSIARNVLNVENHVEKYALIISELKNENQQLKNLLQNSPNNLRGGFQEISPSKEITYDYKDGLVNEIKQHFDEELQSKKKVFDSEMHYDEVEEKIMAMNNEANVSEDKILKAKYDELLSTQKRLAYQADDFKREYAALSSRRNLLQTKIQKEKSREGITYLTSIFKQNQMIIENMDLQHKDKRIENQMRLKDKELKYLQNQLALRGGKLSDSALRNQQVDVSHRSNQNTLRLNEEPIVSAFNDQQEDSLSFLAELNELGNSGVRSPQLKVFNQAKKALNLPSINSKNMYSSPNQASSNKVLNRPIKKHEYGFVGNEKPINKNAHSQQSSQYYYNKQEFMIAKSQPFENSRSKPKKRVGYVSAKSKITRDIMGPKRKYSEDERSSERTQQPQQQKKTYFSAKQAIVKSLNDLNMSSSTTSSNPHLRKKNILKELNKKDAINMKAFTKAQAFNRNGNRVQRYESSPYIKSLRDKSI